MTPEAAHIRALLAEAVKQAQEELIRARFDLDEFDRLHGKINRLDQTRAYQEVTGRSAFAGAETTGK